MSRKNFKKDLRPVLTELALLIDKYKSVHNSIQFETTKFLFEDDFGNKTGGYMLYVKLDGKQTGGIPIIEVPLTVNHEGKSKFINHKKLLK
jgi:hypothetical protein